MTQWIYLSKHGQDEYVNMFAQGAGQTATQLETWQYHSSQDSLVIRGIMKHKLIKQCWSDQRVFRFVDTGYFGNHVNEKNPHGWKHWHRIVPNNLQHNTIMPVPADRWQQHNIKLQPRRHGSKIVIAVPDEKPCIFYGVDLDTWLTETVKTVRNHTDRPIEIRHRDPNRQNRQRNSLTEALQNAHALITFNSNAATEAIMQGVPSFVLAPCHAASPVASTDLTKIDDPWWADDDLRHQWVCSLAYGQFHISEMRSGAAHKILDSLQQQLGTQWNIPS